MSLYIPYAKQSLASDGADTGEITVSDARAFKKGATVFLSADDQETIQLVVEEVTSVTTLFVKEPVYYIYGRFDASNYTVVQNATLTQPPQFDLTFGEEDAVATGGGGGTVDQGVPNTLANGWPVKITDGTNVLGTASNPIRVNPTGATTQPVSGTVTANQGTPNLISNAWFSKITDGTDVLGTLVKPLNVQEQEQTYTAVFNYTGDNLTSVVTTFSDGRILTKTFSYTGNNLTGVTTSYA